MCGFCGIIPLDKNLSADPAAMRAMRAALVHRGPDSEGELVREGGALGFRRLSILDLEHGGQPMLSDDGSAAIVFNGEIYNHPQLRAELEASGEKYRTRTDTESILRLYLREGADCVKKLRGMFAFAVWDFKNRRLTLARDHIGIKPLYYAVHNGKLYFSSELRSLLKAGLPVSFDPAGLRDYLEYNFVHAPKTVLAGIYKLPAGGRLVIDLERGALPDIEKYYTLPVSDCSEITDENEALERLDLLLNESVKGHLLSDVPVGSFLSGGVDSSLVTALMCRHYPGKVKTFSIGFSGGRAGLDESPFSREAAKYLGTEHYELILDAKVLSDIPALLCALDEPLGDSAILPTYLLSRHAAKEVKVALSGEGADELFGGYGRYKAAYLSYIMGRLGPASGAAAALVKFFSSDKYYKAVPFKSQDDWLDASRHSPAQTALSALTPQFAAQAAKTGNFWRVYVENGKGFNTCLAADFRTVMADCLLMKVDKATMAASIEARVPMLTPEIASFACRLKPEWKLRRFKSKWLLRRLAEKYLPHNIVWRKKHGFWAPWEEWLKTGPREVYAALDGAALRDEGALDSARLRTDLDSLRSGGTVPDSGLTFRCAILALWRQALSL